jgi:predicted N-acetyltransferase YhbS
MSDLNFSISPELPADNETIERLNARIFGPGRFARTAARLREGAAQVTELSFTARVGTLMIGSIRYWHQRVGSETKAVLLGPLTIEPLFQGKGIGGALMRASLAVAKEKHPVILLIGDPKYYVKYGFVEVEKDKITLPTPENPSRFQILSFLDKEVTGALRPYPYE